MADDTERVGKTKKCYTYARNLVTQPREFKIGGKWYRWNALGTEGDTLDVTNVNMTGYEQYFEIRSVEK